MANVARLIDANALKLRAINVSTVRSHTYMKAVGTREIDKAPTVDAVPVVRCRECLYYNRALQLCNNGLGARPFEFYCADGKKMDGGAD